MDVTLISTGNMGRVIGHRLVAGGHSLTLVDSNLKPLITWLANCAVWLKTVQPSIWPR